MITVILLHPNTKTLMISIVCHEPKDTFSSVLNSHWPTDRVRGLRLTPAPETPSTPLAPPTSYSHSSPRVPGESIQLDRWLQTGGLGPAMFLWHCMAQIPLSTEAQLNHSPLITVKAALARAPHHHVQLSFFCSSPIWTTPLQPFTSNPLNIHILMSLPEKLV